MEAKLARASHRQRQLTMHQIERQRSTAMRLQPTHNISLQANHQPSSASKGEKILAIRQQRRMKLEPAATYPDHHLVTPPHAGIAQRERDHEARSTELITSNQGTVWRPQVSLEEVMVEKKPQRKRLDSFELVCPPTSRVIAMEDEPPTLSFHHPAQVEEDEEGWERIGIDGETEEDQESATPPSRSWVGVVLGLEKTA